VLFGADRHPAITEMIFSQRGIPRKIELRVPGFSALPLAVIGTDRVATMYRRHAEYFAQFLPLTIHPSPIELPEVTEMVQWHKSRASDPGIKWLIEQLALHAQNIASDMAG
ncbi:MAG: LysR family transcriptional regulator, partial [Pseudomonadota bacterium]|nr:LysR family transcriptional regulator [Pseudomonadota bacterium]